MPKFEPKSTWNDIKEKMKQKYPGLTDRDLGCPESKDNGLTAGSPKRQRRRT